MHTCFGLALIVLAACAPAALAAQCNAVSGERRVALLELYTSEGCDSCLAARLVEINRAPAQASIRLSLAPQITRLAVTGAWTAVEGVDAAQAQGWLALYENGLATDVRAGENRGKRLQHDFVVRELAGPFPVGAFAHAFPLDAKWKQADLGVAAFVHDVRSGAALQALAVSGCRSN